MISLPKMTRMHIKELNINQKQYCYPNTHRIPSFHATGIYIWILSRVHEFNSQCVWRPLVYAHHRGESPIRPKLEYKAAKYIVNSLKKYSITPGCPKNPWKYHKAKI